MRRTVLVKVGVLVTDLVEQLLGLGVASTKGWSIVRPPLAWGGGLGAAVLIGAIAGLWPALRAARLSPTEALWSL